METCSGTHFIARQLAALGHDVRLACVRIQRHGEKANRAGRISTTQLANRGPFGTVFPPTWQPRFGGAFSYRTRNRRTAHNLVSRRRLGSYTYLRAHNFERAAAFVAIPDAFVIDYENEQWYIVKAELIAHGVWRHIVPQITSGKRFFGRASPQGIMLDDGKIYSPSIAAIKCYARVGSTRPTENGWRVWKNKDQLTLNELFDQLQSRKEVTAADRTTQGGDVGEAR